MSERQDKLIKNNIGWLRTKMQGSTLFGEPIDMNNPDHLILAAFLIGQQMLREEIQSRHNAYNLLRDRMDKI